jgi:transcriptional regulator of acetoin/glycerol metabolism
MEQTKAFSTQESFISERMNAVQAQYRTLSWQREHDETRTLRAWQRCQGAGLAPSDSVQFEPVSRSLLASIDDTHHDLITRARPHVESVRNSIVGTGCIAMLINQRGMVIDRYGLTDLAPVPLMNVSRKGTNLDERCIGSSGPSLALAERQPSLVMGDAHFCNNLRSFFCAAAPIDGPQGQLLGALDISAYDTLPRFDVLSLVEDTAAAIENSFIEPDAEHVLLRFQVIPAWIDTPRQAIVAVRSDGRITGANRIALSLLGITRQELQTTTFRDLFDRDPNRLFGRQHMPSSGLVEWVTSTGLVIVGRLDCKTDPTRLIATDASAAMMPAASGPAETIPGAGRFAAGGVKLRELEMSAIEQTLDRLGGNVSAAARELGVSRNTIYRRLANMPDEPQTA